MVEGEKVVPKQTPGVTPDGRERGSSPWSQGREEVWVSLACWSCGRRMETVWSAARERESTDWSSNQQPVIQRQHHVQYCRIS